MTVSPAPCDAMCSDPSVIAISVKVRSSSSSDLRRKLPENSTPSSHSEADGPMTSQRSCNAPASSEVTPIAAPRTRRASDVVGDREGVLPLSSISETVSASSKVVCFGEAVVDVGGLDKLWAIPPGTGIASVDDSSKLVYQLSRELAVLDALLLGVGGDTDSDRLREELWQCQQRSFSLAQQNASCLVPLIRGKSSLKKEEGSEVERLYRIYSGCLEYLVYLLHKLRSLLCLFHLHHDAGCLIQTGLTDPLSFVPKTSCIPKDGAPAQISGQGPSNHSVQPSHLNDHPKRLGRDIQTIQTLLCLVNNASDVQPWDVVEEGADFLRLNVSSMDNSKRPATRTVTFQERSTQRSRVMCKVIAGLSLFLIVAVIVLASVLTTS